MQRSAGKNFTRGFLFCAPGLTIKDRLRVLQPNDHKGYYAILLRADILNGEDRIDLSIHQMIEILDSGLVVLKEFLAVRDDA